MDRAWQLNTDLITPAFSNVAKDAKISPCTRYRYTLSRWWDHEKPAALFWMLNPSTADAAIDDPTIRRCMGFARRENLGGIMVVNWFALRATDPDELGRADEPVGPENFDEIRRCIHELCLGGPVIAAWGSHGAVQSVIHNLPSLIGKRALKCLGTTKAGAPRHPLYVRGDQPLVDWRVPA